MIRFLFCHWGPGLLVDVLYAVSFTMSAYGSSIPREEVDVAMISPVTVYNTWRLHIFLIIDYYTQDVLKYECPI